MAKKYIDADKLKTKVKKLNLVTKTYEEQVAFNNALAMVVEIIDSFQQEQSCDNCTNDKGCVTCKDGELWEGKEQPSEDLESEIEKYFQGLWPGMETAEQCNTDMHFTPTAVMRLACHFAEWQKEQDLKEMAQSKSPLSVAYANRCFENGKQAMKEQMLKEAVNARVTYSEYIPGDPYIEVVADIPNPTGVRYKDKVKIIIVPIKED